MENNLEAIAERNTKNSKKKSKKSLWQKTKDLVYNNAKKIGVGIGNNAKKVGVGIGILASIVSSYFIDLKHVEAQESVRPTSTLNRNEEGPSGMIKTTIGGYSDQNASEDDFWDRYRSFIRGEGIFSFGESNPKWSLFTGYEYKGPARDLGRAEEFNFGLQITYFPGLDEDAELRDFFINWLVAYKHNTFGDEDYNRLTYVEGLHRLVTKLGFGVDMIAESGFYGSLDGKFTFNLAEENKFEDYINNFQFDWGVEALLEWFFGEKKEGDLYFKASFESENSQEYFISEAVKLNTLSLEGGFDYLFDDVFNLGASFTYQRIMGNDANFDDYNVWRPELRAGFKLGDFSKLTLSFWYEMNDKAKNEGGAALTLSLYLPKLPCSSSQHITEPSGKKGEKRNPTSGGSGSPGYE